MHLIQKTWQHRRDFNGIFACTHCGHQEEIKNCYDDHHFHTNVIPSWECRECGEAGGGVKTTPDVPAHVII